MSEVGALDACDRVGSSNQKDEMSLATCNSMASIDAYLQCSLTIERRER